MKKIIIGIFFLFTFPFLIKAPTGTPKASSVAGSKPSVFTRISNFFNPAARKSAQIQAQQKASLEVNLNQATVPMTANPLYGGSAQGSRPLSIGIEPTHGVVAGKVTAVPSLVQPALRSDSSASLAQRPLPPTSKPLSQMQQPLPGSPKQSAPQQSAPQNSTTQNPNLMYVTLGTMKQELANRPAPSSPSSGNKLVIAGKEVTYAEISHRGNGVIPAKPKEEPSNYATLSFVNSSGKQTTSVGGAIYAVPNRQKTKN